MMKRRNQVVECGLGCGWPANPACAQQCYESGTDQAQRLLEDIQQCAQSTGCGADPACIQSACAPEVSLCLSN